MPEALVLVTCLETSAMDQWSSAMLPRSPSSAEIAVVKRSPQTEAFICPRGSSVANASGQIYNCDTCNKLVTQLHEAYSGAFTSLEFEIGRLKSEINLRHKDVVLALAAAPCRQPTFDAAIDTPVTSTAFQVGCTNDNDEVPSAVRQSHGLNAAARQNSNDAQLGEHKTSSVSDPADIEEEMKVSAEEKRLGQLRMMARLSQLSERPSGGLEDSDDDDDDDDGSSSANGFCQTLRRARRCMDRFVRSERVEVMFAMVILVNAIVIAVECQYSGIQIGYDLEFPGSSRSAASVWPHGQTTFDVSEWCFGLIFTVEVCLKLFAKWLHFFANLWNVLDLFISVMFIFDKATLDTMQIDPSTIRLLRLLRLLRMVRLLRTLETCDALFLMVTALRGSASILVWALVVLFLMLLTAAILINQVLHATYFSDASQPLETRRLIYEYFGSCTRSLFSMFEITMANWPQASRLLAEHVSEWFMVVCLTHKLIVGFAVIGVINGVFIQETFKVASSDDDIMVRSKRKAMSMHRKRMNLLFQILDESGDGRINFDEFTIIATNPTVKAWLSSMELDPDDLETLFFFIDSDGDGTLSCEELIEGVARTKGTARCLDVMKVLFAMRKGSARRSSMAQEPPQESQIPRKGQFSELYLPTDYSNKFLTSTSARDYGDQHHQMNQ